MPFWKENKQCKNGSWNLSSDYLKYRSEGGSMSPAMWNSKLKEIKYDLGLSVRKDSSDHKDKMEAKE